VRRRWLPAQRESVADAMIRLFRERQQQEDRLRAKLAEGSVLVRIMPECVSASALRARPALRA
jgi:hypothetical protein